KIKKNDIAPVIFLHGEGTYFIQNIKKELQKQVTGNDMENLSVYDLQETPIQEVITDTETYPFFGDKKLIIAENPSFVLNKSPKLAIEHQLESLQEYISSPVDYSVLLIIAPYEKIDQRKKVTQMLTKKCLSMKFEQIKEWEQKKWIDQFSKLYNVKINANAKSFLKERLPIDLQRMENEFIKLSLAVDKEGTVTKDLAENLISQSMDSTAFSLIDAVIEKNTNNVFSIFKELSTMNESALGLLALLSQQFRTILQVKLLKHKGYNEFQMQKQIGGHPYVIKLASEREKRFNKNQLINIMNQLTETDHQIKSGMFEEDLAIE